MPRTLRYARANLAEYPRFARPARAAGAATSRSCAGEHRGPWGNIERFTLETGSIDVHFGVSTQLYHAQRLRHDHLAEVAAHGFDTVEIFATRSHFDYHDPAALDAAGRLADGRRACACTRSTRRSSERCRRRRGSAPCRTRPPTAPRARGPSARREAALELPARVPVSRRWWCTSGCRTRSGRRPARTAATRRAAASRRSRRRRPPLGVRVALEVIPNALSTPERWCACSRTSSTCPTLGVCLDFGHAHLMGDVVDAIETLSGHARRHARARQPRAARRAPGAVRRHDRLAGRAAWRCRRSATTAR